MKDTEGKRLVLLGIRKKGERKFKIQSSSNSGIKHQSDYSLKDRSPVFLAS